MKKEPRLIPFKLAGKPASFNDGTGKSWQLGDVDLQAEGLPEEVFKRIEKTGRIKALHETKPKEIKENGNKK